MSSKSNNKKKKAKKALQPQQFLSEEEYIRTQVRKLSIYKAYMTPVEIFKDTGRAAVMIVRQHTGGNFTFAQFLWEQYGKGLDITLHGFRYDEIDYNYRLDLFIGAEFAKEVDYAVVHNFMYQALACEQEINDGVWHCESFDVDKFLLEPEDAVEKMDLGIDFAKVANDARLDRKTEYVLDRTYNCPDVIKELYDAGFDQSMPREMIDRILAIPHEELRVDLENLIQSYIAGGEPAENEDASGHMIAAVLFLGMIGDACSLPVLLELLQQDYDFIRSYFYDLLTDVIAYPIANCFHEQYDLIEEYLKTPDIEYSNKNVLLEVISEVLPKVVKNKSDIVNLIDRQLQFVIDEDDGSCYDYELTGFLVWSCVSLEAKELLPKIKILYDRGDVDKSVCGNYESVNRDMNKKPYIHEFPMDIYAYYSQDW